MSISGIFFLDPRGKVLISRDYRGCASQIDSFFPLIQGEESTLKPVIQGSEGTSYVYVKSNQIYLVASSKSNSNAALAVVFLHQVLQTMKDYFRVLEEESVKDNFVLIHELLDEFADFGYPQITDPKILSKYVTQEGRGEVSLNLPQCVTNAVSWRAEGIFYKKNEVFLDVVESVDFLVNSRGAVLKSEIQGCIRMKVRLSGMPELRLGLNDKVLLENAGRDSLGSVELDHAKFHQCVRLSRFYSDRTIVFVPPDGDFELMSYRLSLQPKPLIWIEAKVERFARSRTLYTVKVTSGFKEKYCANDVEVWVPVERDVDSPEIRTSAGKGSYCPGQNALVWKMKSLGGEKECCMDAQFLLPSVEGEDSAQHEPIRVKFKIPYFTSSGLYVRYLKVIEVSGYKALPWVRYYTQNGEYHLRIS